MTQLNSATLQSSSLSRSALAFETSRENTASGGLTTVEQLLNQRTALDQLQERPSGLDTLRDQENGQNTVLFDAGKQINNCWMPAFGNAGLSPSPIGIVKPLPSPADIDFMGLRGFVWVKFDDSCLNTTV